MARSTKSYEERLLQLEKREQESLEKAKQYAAQKRELKKRQKDVETKKRTHRLCQIGGAVESVIGSAIEEEDIPKLVGFLKRQEANGKFFSKAMQKEPVAKYGGSVMPEGVGFPFPSLLFMKAHLWTTRGRPYKFATGGNRSALTLAGLVPSAGISCRPAHVAGGTLRQRGAFHAGCYAQGTLTQRAFRQIPFSFWENVTCRKSKPDTAERGETEHGDFSLYSKDCWTQQREIHHISICVSQW